MTGLYLATITVLIGALAVTLWGHDRQTIRANKAEGALAEAQQRIYVADLVNDTLVENLRVAWGEPADDIDQAVQLANSPRYESIVDLIASNEAARFDADGVDWGQA